jgi:hypothetical protein
MVLHDLILLQGSACFVLTIGKTVFRVYPYSRFRENLAGDLTDSDPLFATFASNLYHILFHHTKTFNKMNKKLFFLLAFLGAAMIVLSPACKKDEECDFGYEKDADGECTVLWQTKFIGSYNTSETCAGVATGTYSNVVSAGSDITKVAITNFGDSGVIVVADLISSTELDIPATNFTIGGTTYSLSGSGSTDGTRMTVDYTATSGGVTAFSCTMDMTKI